MFLFRSAFWLVVGFLLVAPHGTNFGAEASQLKDQAIGASLAAGEQMLQTQPLATRQIAAIVIDSLSTPSAVLPMQDSPAVPAVFPRPRPAAMG